MSLRGRSTCLRLAKNIIATNSAPLQKRLRGGVVERGAACKRMADVIASIRMGGRGAEWRKSKQLDIVISDLRKVAADLRLTAGVRSSAVVSLCVIEGFLPTDELGDGPQDQYIKQLISMPVASQPTKRIEPPQNETLEEKIARLSKQFGGLDERVIQHPDH